jgi:hypothetical protein
MYKSVRKVSILIIFGEDTNYEALHYAITSSLLGPNIFLSTLFSNTLSLYSPLKFHSHARLTLQRGVAWRTDNKITF